MFDFVKPSYLIFLGLPREKRDASAIRTHAGIPTDLGFQDQCITALPSRRRRFYALRTFLSTVGTVTDTVGNTTLTGTASWATSWPCWIILLLSVLSPSTARMPRFFAA